jgi:hypothetical protein
VNYTQHKYYLQFFFDKNFKKILHVLQVLFVTNNNVLFIDFSFNFNYLPIKNELLFNRSYKQLLKLVKFFNVGLILVFNLNNKPFYAKKILNLGVVSLSASSCFAKNVLDLNVSTNNLVYNYTLYIATLQLYVNCKKCNIKYVSDF